MATASENKDEDKRSAYSGARRKLTSRKNLTINTALASLQINASAPQNRHTDIAVEATKSSLADVVGFTDPSGRTSCATTEYAHYRLRCLGLVKAATAAKKDLISKRALYDGLQDKVRNNYQLRRLHWSTALGVDGTFAAGTSVYEPQISDGFIYEAAAMKQQQRSANA